MNGLVPTARVLMRVLAVSIIQIGIRKRTRSKYTKAMSLSRVKWFRAWSIALATLDFNVRVNIEGSLASRLVSFSSRENEQSFTEITGFPRFWGMERMHMQ